MTIAADLTASLITLDRLHEVLLEDGHNHRATILGLVIDNLRDCAERARLIEEGTVPRHWLPQAATAAEGVVSLAIERARRGAHRTLAALGVLTALAGGAQAQPQAYVNAFAGVALFDSTVSIGGTTLVDQGGDAVTGGARAGLGHRWPYGLYLGLEAEAFAAYGRSRAVVNGQAYSLDLHGGAGGFLRAGWMQRGGALFFARAGAQALFTGTGTHWAPAVGLGAEVPIAGGIYARADLTYAWNGTETYQASAGLGWRW